MQYCVHCGHYMTDGSGMCDLCGSATQPPEYIDADNAPYCAGCGALVPSGSEYCPLCGTCKGNAPEIQAQGSIPKLEAGARVGHMSIAEGKHKLTAFASLIALLLFLGVAAICTWRFLPYILPGEAPTINSAALYDRGNGELMLSFPDREPIRIAERFIAPKGAESEIARSSTDGRYLAYLNAANGDASTLYLIDLTRLDRPDLQPPEGALISAGNVDDYRFTQRGNGLVYLSGGGLFAWHDGREWPLDEGVDRIIDVNGRDIIYAKHNSEGGENLYLNSLEEGADDRELIASGIAELLDFSEDYTAFLLTRQQADSREDTYEILYCDTRLHQTQTLASGVSEVLGADASRKMALFAKTRPLAPRYEDFVNDGLAARDASMKRPTPEDFELPENFEELFGDAPDTDNRQQELELEDLYYDAYRAYLKALEDYGEKLERDELRERVRSRLAGFARRGVQTHSLHLYWDNAAHVLDEDIMVFSANGLRDNLVGSVQADLAAGTILYVKGDPKDVRPVSLDSWRESGFDIAAHFSKGVPQQLCHMTFTGAPKTLYYDDGLTWITDFTSTNSGGSVYFVTQPRDGRDPSRDLFHVSMAGGEPSDPALLDTDMEALFGGASAFDGMALYLKESPGGSHDLMGVRAGSDPAVILADVSPQPEPVVKNSGKTLLYYKSYGVTAADRGDLYLYITQERMVIGDVYAYDYRADNLIYLVRNKAQDGSFELQAYRQGGVSTINTNVQALYDIAHG